PPLLPGFPMRSFPPPCRGVRIRALEFSAESFGPSVFLIPLNTNAVHRTPMHDVAVVVDAFEPHRARRSLHPMFLWCSLTRIRPRGLGSPHSPPRLSLLPISAP